MARIYLDHNATTPLAPEALEAMLPVLSGLHGNPSSIHTEGAKARYVLEKARRSMESALEAPRDSLVFVATGSEANHLGLRGMALAARAAGRGNHIIVGAAEHRAVLETAESLAESDGFEVTLATPDVHARHSPESIAGLVRKDTAVVSVMLANNETGAISPVAAVAEAARRANQQVRIHTDAVQAVGRVAVSFRKLGVDTMAFAAHKFHGPRGAAGLVVGPGAGLARQVPGGPQEHGLRAGTENVAAIRGAEAALRLALERLSADGLQILALREALWAGFMKVFGPQAHRLSPREDCLPGTLNVSVEGIEGRQLVRLLDERHIAISAGSACTSSGETLSHAILAARVPPELARGAARFSLGRGTTAEEIRLVIEALADIRESLKEGPQRCSSDAIC